jgi:hypothetical protein
MCIAALVSSVVLAWYLSPQRNASPKILINADPHEQDLDKEEEYDYVRLAHMCTPKKEVNNAFHLVLRLRT